MKILIKMLPSLLFCFCLSSSASQLDLTSEENFSGQSDLAVVCGAEQAGIQQDAIYGHLTFGFHWFSDQLISGKAVSICNQNQSNEKFFDPNKNHMLIFIHGWSPYSTTKGKRFNFNANAINGPDVTDLAAPWLSTTNVAVWYWNQFADELPASVSPADVLKATAAAEAKVWRSDGPQGMRWRNINGDYQQAALGKAPSQIDGSLSQTFADQYISDLTDYAKNNSKADIRLVGESLGTQMVIHGASLIAHQVQAGQLPENLIPQQIVLLDPMVTNADNMNTLVSDIQYLKSIGVVISGYRTSDVGVEPGVPNTTQLLKYTAFSDMTPCSYTYSGPIPSPGYTPQYMDYLQHIENQHTFGVWWYMLSYTLPGVPVAGQADSAPFANMPLADLKARMDDTDTKFVSDNAYNKANNLCGTSTAQMGNEWSQWRMATATPKDGPRS